jgi:hypothetical protein
VTKLGRRHTDEVGVKRVERAPEASRKANPAKSRTHVRSDVGQARSGQAARTRARSQAARTAGNPPRHVSR